MHGLVNRSLECFIRETYGAACWQEIRVAAGLDFDAFEAMLSYDDHLTEAVITAAAARLDRPREALLEDFGHYLVTAPGCETLRRLFRFGGESFADFVHSLARLRDRGRLVLPDLDLPDIAVQEGPQGHFALRPRWSGAAPVTGFCSAIVGLLRAMADDYGALALCEHRVVAGEGDVVIVRMLASAHSEGRAFDLGRAAES